MSPHFSWVQIKLPALSLYEDDLDNRSAHPLLACMRPWGQAKILEILTLLGAQIPVLNIT